MTLTQEQLTILKAAILSDQALASKPMNSDGHFDITVEMNKSSVPEFFVWKSSVAVTEIMGNGFDWTRVDNLTVGKARIWEFMTSIGTVNPSQSNVRAGFEACFSVEAADGPNRQAIYTHSVRLSSRVEKLFATGAGTAPNNHGVGPAAMAFEGPLSPSDVEKARGLP